MYQVVLIVYSFPQNCCRPAARPEEIIGWLRIYNDRARREGRPTVGKFCAIDDRSLLHEKMGNKLQGHFVQTIFAHGLTDDVARRVVECLA